MAVKQVENLLGLLEFFAERKRPATLAEVVAHFGWPRSSAFHILSTLFDSGYLYEPMPRAGYYPTPRWLQLSKAITEAEPIPDRLVSIMMQLASETGETVCIAATSGVFAVFLDVAESSASVRYAASPGKRVPIHATASGHSLLSRLPEHDLTILLRKIVYEKYGHNTPQNAEEVRAQIEAGQQRGWFQSASHYSPDLGGVSLPVAEAARVFAITIAGPLFRVADKAQYHAELLKSMLEDER